MAPSPDARVPLASLAAATIVSRRRIWAAVALLLALVAATAARTRVPNLQVWRDAAGTVRYGVAAER